MFIYEHKHTFYNLSEESWPVLRGKLLVCILGIGYRGMLGAWPVQVEEVGMASIIRPL